VTLRSACVLVLGFVLVPFAHAQDPAPAARPVTVASKPFGESFLLAEMFAQLLEARGFSVQRRAGLGATEIAFGALREDAIDVYPEYTGTGLVAILGEDAGVSAGDAFARVATVFRERWGVRWLPPLGFENTYAIAVRRQTADSLGLRTLSDLAPVAGRLIGGFTPDFLGRRDGLPGLSAAYGLVFRETRSLVQAVKYQALAAGGVDVIDGYSTDGFIARYDLVVLEDDLVFFPPYEAAALVSARLQRDSPGAIAVLTELSGRLDVAAMRALNLRVEAEGEEIPVVARAALRDLSLIDVDPAAGAARGDIERVSLISYLWSRRATLADLSLRHLLLVGVSMALAILVAVPLGLALERTSGADHVIRAVGLLQVMPGIALLAFMIPLLGIGIVPALVALFLYSLYPVLRNTWAGVRNASPDAVNAAESLGMTSAQILRHIRLPLAAPVIMAGVRTAAAINVGTATLAAFIGAGGLGDPIVAGLALSDTRMILSGAIPAALLALILDGVLALLERTLRPGGLG
jgi:osmoprotectant transport system permease protein